MSVHVSLSHGLGAESLRAAVENARKGPLLDVLDNVTLEPRARERLYAVDRAARPEAPVAVEALLRHDVTLLNMLDELVHCVS